MITKNDRYIVSRVSGVYYIGWSVKSSIAFGYCEVRRLDEVVLYLNKLASFMTGNLIYHIDEDYIVDRILTVGEVKRMAKIMAL